MPTMKVEPWGEGQGDHVVIEESDFDPEVHEKLGSTKKSSEPETDIGKMKVSELKAALTEAGIEIPDDAKKADLVALLEQATAE